jgi:hypothetical protein
MERVFYLPTDERQRLAVYVGEPRTLAEGLIDIADEDCTSSSCRETTTPATAVTRVCMTREAAAWLRDVLIGLDLGAAPSAVLRSACHEYSLGPGDCPVCVGTAIVRFQWSGRGWTVGGTTRHLSACPWHPDTASDCESDDCIRDEPCEGCCQYSCVCEEEEDA